MEVVMYILQSNRQTFYCGITNCLLRRWNEHKRGKSKYCKLYGAKAIVYLEWFDSYEEARQREKEIKRGGVRKNWLRLQNKLQYY